MSDQEQQPQITADTPVSKEELQQLDLIGRSRSDAANHLASLELEKVAILRVLRDLDVERDRLYSQILATRGLNPGSKVRIDGKTGAIAVLAES